MVTRLHEKYSLLVKKLLSDFIKWELFFLQQLEYWGWGSRAGVSHITFPYRIFSQFLLILFLVSIMNKRGNH